MVSMDRVSCYLYGDMTRLTTVKFFAVPELYNSFLLLLYSSFSTRKLHLILNLYHYFTHPLIRPSTLDTPELSMSYMPRLCVIWVGISQQLTCLLGSSLAASTAVTHTRWSNLPLLSWRSEDPRGSWLTVLSFGAWDSQLGLTWRTCRHRIHNEHAS